MQIPADRRYTEAHEWVLSMDDGATVRIGITDFAQDALGDIVYADLPEVGLEVEAGDTLAEVESTKSVGEIYAPLAGAVVKVNAALDESPESINADPYGEGWIVAMELADSSALDTLLDAVGYRALTEDA